MKSNLCDFTTRKARQKTGHHLFDIDFYFLILFWRAPWLINPKMTEFPRDRICHRHISGTCKKFQGDAKNSQGFLCWGWNVLLPFFETTKNAVFAVQLASLQPGWKPGLLKTVSSCMAGRSNKKYCRDQTWVFRKRMSQVSWETKRGNHPTPPNATVSPPQEIAGLTKGLTHTWSLSNPRTRPASSCKGGIWGGGTLRIPIIFTQKPMKFLNIRAWQEAKGVVLCRGFMWLASLQQTLRRSQNPRANGPPGLYLWTEFFPGKSFPAWTSPNKNEPRNKPVAWFFLVFLRQEFGFGFWVSSKTRLVERFKGTR